MWAHVLGSVGLKSSPRPGACWDIMVSAGPCGAACTACLLAFTCFLVWGGFGSTALFSFIRRELSSPLRMDHCREGREESVLGGATEQMQYLQHSAICACRDEGL